MKELIVALDLELNQPSGRVVQIGAVLGNVRTGNVVSQFDVKVNPGGPFSLRIAELTGISPQQIESAPSLAEAGQALAAWLAPRDSVRLLNPLTWGGGDTETLRDQLGFASERWIFGRRWIDVKTLYVAWRMAQGKDISGGLARAMTKLGLSFRGRKHDALDDSLNTFRIYRALLAQFMKSEYLQVPIESGLDRSARRSLTTRPVSRNF
jgi:inhibitor of KinA sporulation pathway (predicted exonuclease)